MWNSRYSRLAWLACASLCFGQAPSTAEISGTVVDSTEGRLPGTVVTVTHRGLGIEWRAVTSGLGEYRIVLLPPGLYDLQVEHAGFARREIQEILLSVGERAVYNIRLAVGSSQQAVEVGSSLPATEEERTEVSGRIAPSVLTNLPIDRRAALGFIYLLPGVSDTRTVADFYSFRVPQSPDSGFSVSGGNGRGNNITVDGDEMISSGGGVRPLVGQEAVLEFQVSRANYSAENGSARGAAVNIVTRSGGNQFGGSIFGFFRHQILDAEPPFALTLDENDQLRRLKPDAHRQQFGASAGGPITRDRLFYFATYERLRKRESQAVPLLTNVSIFEPTAEQQAFLKAAPAATRTALAGLFAVSADTQAMFRQNSGLWPFYTDQHQGSIRLDYRYNDRNQFNIRMYGTASDESNRNVSGLTAASRGDVEDDFAVNTGLAWSHVFSARTANEFRAQFNYADLRTSSREPYGPDVEIAGFGSFNRDHFLPSETTGRREEVVDNLHITHGHHTIKTGTMLLVRNTHSDTATLFSGRFTFGAVPLASLGPAFAGITITALQAFNLGWAESYQQGFGNPVVTSTYPFYGAYFQNAWRARPGLLLNYGLRWEADNRRPPLPSNRLNFSPRFGFSWSPAQDLTVRGGYGIFYSPIEYQIDYAVTALNEIGGTRQITQILTTLDQADPFAANGPINVFTTLRNQRVIGIPFPKRSITAADLTQFGITVNNTGPRPPFAVLARNSPDFQNAYAQHAAIELERKVRNSLVLTAGVVSVRGDHLTTSYDANLLAAPIDPHLGIRNWGATAENPTGLRYFRDPLLFQDNVYESGANSWYTAGTVEAKYRFQKRLSMAANYTFSKAIDETTDYEPDYQPADQTCRRCERGRAPFDQRHKVVLFGEWEAPGSFLIAPIFRYNSPHPFNLLAGIEMNNDRHYTTDRPLYTGRNIGIGPAYHTFDMRIGRTFRMGERRSVQLIAEAFNVFNHLNYATVNNIVGADAPADTHGRGDRTPSQPMGFTSAYDARRLQVGFRFRF